jgi:fructose-1,6-bisphosphatase
MNMEWNIYDRTKFGALEINNKAFEKRGKRLRADTYAVFGWTTRLDMRVLEKLNMCMYNRSS